MPSQPSSRALRAAAYSASSIKGLKTGIAESAEVPADPLATVSFEVTAIEDGSGRGQKESGA